jgi:hypothetical protein
MYSILERFKDNKLLLNHVFKIVKTSFNLLQNIKESDSFKMILVSSAKRMGAEILFNAKGIRVFVQCVQLFRKCYTFIES